MKVGMSSKWRIATFVGEFAIVTFCLFLFFQLDPDEIVTRVLIGTTGVIILVAGIESLDRQYEFNQDSIKFRHWFRWREYTVPRSLSMSEVEGAIYFYDNQARRNFLILTREYNRVGTLIDELSDFYNGHGRTVFVERNT